MNKGGWLHFTYLLGATLFFVHIGCRCAWSYVFTQAEHPCTPDESWSYDARMPNAWRQFHQVLTHQPDQLLQELTQSYAFHQRAAELTRDPEAIILTDLHTDYAIYRAYHDLGLVHLAYRGFTALAQKAQSPSLRRGLGVRMAALGCLHHLHDQFPSLKLSSQLSPGLRAVDGRGLGITQRGDLYQAALSIAAKKVSELGGKADLSNERAILAGSPLTLRYLDAIMAASQGQDQVIINSIPPLLAQKSLPFGLESLRNALRLNLARAYFNQRKYEQSITPFRSLTSESNLFIQAIQGQGWAQLQANHVEAAVGAAFNLMAGELRNTFTPDAPLIAAIAYFEGCHYPEAMNAVRYFRKVYDPSYKWLYDWNNLVRTNPQDPGTDLYRMTTQFLLEAKGMRLSRKTRKGRPPLNVLSEWVRSPIFLTSQQEINLLLDEKSASHKLLQGLAQLIKADAHLAPKTRALQERLHRAIYEIVRAFSSSIASTQQSLIGQINHELSFLNRYMVAQWLDNFKNSQLLEVEIFNMTGERLTNKKHDALGSKSDAPLPTITVAAKSAELPTLDWGKFSLLHQDDEEIWEDEVGFLQTSTQNICKSVGKGGRP